jgi:hypothetical protein
MKGIRIAVCTAVVFLVVAVDALGAGKFAPGLWKGSERSRAASAVTE